MEKFSDVTHFSKLMSCANMGWWQADLEKEIYICSDYIAELLGVKKNGIISFEDFNKRILNENQQPTTVSSFDAQLSKPETVYLFDTSDGAVWLRSKICYRETCKNGVTKVYGIAERQDAPDMATAYQALQRNERVLHNIYRNLPVGIELYDTDGILIDLNDKEIEMFHLDKKEDILGINIFENPLFPNRMKEKLKNYEDIDFTFRYEFSKIGDYYKTSKKEGAINLATKVTTLYDDNRNPINYLLINADKTETTIAYDKIQEFENTFDLLGDFAKVGYACYNMVTQQGYAQKSWYKNVGEKNETPLSEIIGIYNHFHPDDHKIIIEFLNKAKKGLKRKFSHEMRILRENGTYTWTKVHHLVKNYAPQDNTIELISINYDITNLKKVEKMLIEARSKAEESDRLKSAFLDNMSHEIRTPLNAIIGFSNLLACTDNENERKEYITLITRNNELLLNLINDVMDLSKIESCPDGFQPEWFNLSELIRESAASYNRRYNYLVIKCLSMCPDTDYLVYLDKLRIKQIMDNLISNAFKNTTHGHIEIFYDVCDLGVKMGVTDTGCGIPEKMIGKIFDRFEKLDSFAQGAGLGLSICKSLIEKMGGSITTVSKVGYGTSFEITLPCKVNTTFT